MARLFCDQGKYRQAVDAYKLSLEIDADQPKLLVDLGRTYVRLKQYKQALATFKLAVKQMPDDATPWVEIGACHFSMGSYDSALEAYNAASALNDKDSLVRSAVHDALQGITGRQASLSPGATEDERRAAQDEWWKWWNENEEQLLDQRLSVSQVDQTLSFFLVDAADLVNFLL